MQKAAALVQTVPEILYCICGELTQNVYYKRNKSSERQTHQAPSSCRHGAHQDLMKLCPKCDTRYSICKKHPELGYQPWMLEERLGRSCKAQMWTYSCRKCVKKGAHLSIVLCPGCKVIPTLSPLIFFSPFVAFTSAFQIMFAGSFHK